MLKPFLIASFPDSGQGPTILAGRLPRERYHLSAFMLQQHYKPGDLERKEVYLAHDSRILEVHGMVRAYAQSFLSTSSMMKNKDKNTPLHKKELTRAREQTQSQALSHQH